MSQALSLEFKIIGLIELIQHRRVSPKVDRFCWLVCIRIVTGHIFDEHPLVVSRPVLGRPGMIDLVILLGRFSSEHRRVLYNVFVVDVFPREILGLDVQGRVVLP